MRRARRAAPLLPLGARALPPPLSPLGACALPSLFFPSAGAPCRPSPLPRRASGRPTPRTGAAARPRERCRRSRRAFRRKAREDGSPRGARPGPPRLRRAGSSRLGSRSDHFGTFGGFVKASRAGSGVATTATARERPRRAGGLCAPERKKKRGGGEGGVRVRWETGAPRRLDPAARRERRAQSHAGRHERIAARDRRGDARGSPALSVGARGPFLAPRAAAELWWSARLERREPGRDANPRAAAPRGRPPSRHVASIRRRDARRAASCASAASQPMPRGRARALGSRRPPPRTPTPARSAPLPRRRSRSRRRADPRRARDQKSPTRLPGRLGSRSEPARAAPGRASPPRRPTFLRARRAHRPPSLPPFLSAALAAPRRAKTPPVGRAQQGSIRSAVGLSRPSAERDSGASLPSPPRAC